MGRRKLKEIIAADTLTKQFYPKRGLKGFFSSTPPSVKTVVDRVSLTVEEGEVFGLLGPNGAGKTTLIKMLSTLLFPSSGKATICGYDVVTQGKLVRETIGLVASDERSFYWRMTGRQNLQFFAALHQLFGKEAEARIDALLESLNLREAMHQPFAEYSTGMRQRLAIARGLLKEPRVLFMDEPTKGLDPLNAEVLLTLIKEQVAGFFKKTILMTTHILSEAEKVCDRVAILNHGKVIASGTIGEIRRSVKREERYLFQLAGLSEASLREIGMLSGVTQCVQQGKNNGSVTLQIHFDQSMISFPNLIDQIQKRGRLLRCTSQEDTFEEAFRTFFLK
jgi:ABC-2 type transport system ATP-binding protein